MLAGNRTIYRRGDAGLSGITEGGTWQKIKTGSKSFPPKSKLKFWALFYTIFSATLTTRSLTGNIYRENGNGWPIPPKTIAALA
jgi:hypothetical protein